MVTHIYEYYLFSGDTEFLQQNLAPLKDSARFYIGFLTDYKGWKVTNPSLSPETTFNYPGGQASITCGPTIDNSMLWSVFGMVLEIQDILNIEDPEFTSEIESLRPQLPPLQISATTGRLMEWIEDYGETDPTNGLSPLWGVYPGRQITAFNSTTWQASLNLFTHRVDSGGQTAGWPTAWIMSLGARFYNSSLVASGVTRILTKYTLPESLMNNGAPAVFQIDANFGAPAAIAEALLQSHEVVTANSTAKEQWAADFTDKNKLNIIRLLPALPSEWTNGGGFVDGLRARGNFQVDVQWNGAGNLVKAEITSLSGNSVWLTLGDSSKKITVSGGGGSGTLVRLETSKNGKYSVTLA